MLTIQYRDNYKIMKDLWEESLTKNITKSLFLFIIIVNH